MEEGQRTACQYCVIVEESENSYGRSTGFFPREGPSREAVANNDTILEPSTDKEDRHVYRCSRRAVAEWGKDITIKGCNIHAPKDILKELDIPIHESRNQKVSV
jgi:hypothetical protein